MWKWKWEKRKKMGLRIHHKQDHFNDLNAFVSGTYSNVENHPALISERTNAKPKIRLSAKTGLPVGVLPTKTKPRPPTIQQSENKGKPRAKDETPEEKALRKKQVKENRKVYDVTFQLNNPRRTTGPQRKHSKWNTSRRKCTKNRSSRPSQQSKCK